MEQLIDVSSALLDVFKGIKVEDLQSLTTSTLYLEMGYTLLKLLELLFSCDPTREHLELLIKNIIHICCNITAAVTVDVFCEWAEVNSKKTLKNYNFYPFLLNQAFKFNWLTLST